MSQFQRAKFRAGVRLRAGVRNLPQSSYNLASTYADPTQNYGLGKRIAGALLSTIEQETINRTGLVGSYIQHRREGSNVSMMGMLGRGILSNVTGSMGPLGAALLAAGQSVPDIPNRKTAETKVSNEELAKSVQTIDHKLTTGLNELREQTKQVRDGVAKQIKAATDEVGKITRRVESLELNKRVTNQILNKMRFQPYKDAKHQRRRAVNDNYNGDDDNTPTPTKRGEAPKSSLVSNIIGAIGANGAAVAGVGAAGVGGIAARKGLMGAAGQIGKSLAGKVFSRAGALTAARFIPGIGWVITGAMIGKYLYDKYNEKSDNDPQKQSYAPPSNGTSNGVRKVTSQTMAMPEINVVDFILNAKQNITFTAEKDIKLKGKTVMIEAQKLIFDVKQFETRGGTTPKEARVQNASYDPNESISGNSDAMGSGSGAGGAITGDSTYGGGFGGSDSSTSGSYDNSTSSGIRRNDRPSSGMSDADIMRKIMPPAAVYGEGSHIDSLMSSSKAAIGPQGDLSSSGKFKGGATAPNDPEILAALNEVASKHNLDPAAISMLIKTESNWQSGQNGRTGSYVGLTQIGKDTINEAKWGFTQDQYAQMSPAEQIRVYGKWLDHYKIDSKLSKAGLDIKSMKPHEQAAILQGLQFAPNATGYLSQWANGNPHARATNTKQASALGATSFADMSQYYERLASKNPGQYDNSNIASGEMGFNTSNRLSFYSGSPDNAAASSIAGMPVVNQKQGKVAAIRKQPLTENLSKALNYVSMKTGVEIDVFSGGQAGIESGSHHRTGSTRHDHGNAADVNMYVRDENGNRRLLDMNNEADRAKMAEVVKTARSAGLTGIGGHPTKYMGPNALHLGYGKEATWGGKGAAPGWLNDAYAEGKRSPVDMSKIDIDKMIAEIQPKNNNKTATLDGSVPSGVILPPGIITDGVSKTRRIPDGNGGWKVVDDNRKKKTINLTGLTDEQKAEAIRQVYAAGYKDLNLVDPEGDNPKLVARTGAPKFQPFNPDSEKFGGPRWFPKDIGSDLARGMGKNYEQPPTVNSQGGIGTEQNSTTEGNPANLRSTNAPIDPATLAPREVNVEKADPVVIQQTPEPEKAKESESEQIDEQKKIEKPTHDPEEESPKPGDDGYGRKHTANLPIST